MGDPIVKPTAVLVATVFVVSACNGTTSPAATNDTTATVAPSTASVPTAGLCGELKVASFDLGAAYDRMLGEDPEALEALSEEEAAELFLTPLVTFYETLGSLAATAPAEVAADLEAVGGMADLLAEAADLAPQLSLTDEVPAATSAAAAGIEEWSRLNCDAEIGVAPEELVTSTLMPALLGALGDAFGDLEGAFEDGGVGGSSNNGSYGDDPELDALWDACEAEAGAPCSDLYWQTFGVYELFGQTCGGRIPLRPGYTVDCELKYAEAGPQAEGDDLYLDSMAASCRAGDNATCDQLFGSAPVGSAYETLGDTCGERRAAGEARPCDWVESAAFQPGDDAGLDELWAGCQAGGADGCSDLYYESSFDSVYEALGDGCGILIGRGEDCALVIDIVSPPAGS